MGETLRRMWGNPYFHPWSARRNIDVAALALVIVGLALAGLATAVTLWGTADLGVIAGPPGGTVLHVNPGSFAWQEGIRPGQPVVAIYSSDSPTGAGIVTSTEGGEVGAMEGAGTVRLRDSLPSALFALALAVIAAIALPWHRRRAAGLAAVSVVVASVPLTVASPVAIEVPARALALAVPAGWITAWGTQAPRTRLLLVGFTLLVSAAWLVAWMSLQSAYDTIDQVRAALAFAGCAGALALQVDPLAVRRRVRALGAPGSLDALALTLLLALAALLQFIVQAPPGITIAVLLAGVAIYPRLRRQVRGALDRLFVADLRDRLTIEAAESERGRLARDLHDVPLQEIAGVIRRLDAVPDVQAEVSSLRAVADHLRQVTTELRSPVLDDLGLAPAIQYFATQLTAQASDFRVETELVTDARPTRDSRPAPEIELAVFRVVQEALANAIRHSGGTHAVITGTISREGIEIAVLDDGHGLRSAALDRAIREGHMGTMAMRQRAASIDADLRFDNLKDGGLAVRLRWPA